MIDPNIFIGEPLLFKGEIYIYPPKVRDVVSNLNFSVYYKLLTLTQEDIKEEVKEKLQQGETCPTPFEYLLAHCQYIQGFIQLAGESIRYFCKDVKSFALEEQKIVLHFEGEKQYCLCESNFFDFQNALRTVMGDKEISASEPEDPNEDPRIRRIKDLARKRDRIKAKQGSKNGISLSTCLVAICCMGIGITPLNIGEMSYASVGEIMKMMQEKEKYDIDIRSLLAGADSKKIKPKYWIRNSND